MSLTRSRFPTLFAAVALLAATSGAAQAQAYPDKNVTFVVPFPPGGVTNLVARTIASAMEGPLGASITVVNRAGAAGTVGTAEVAKASPDGYTIGISTSTPLLLQPHTANLPYGLDSFDYICKAYNNPIVLAAKKDSDFDTLEKVLGYGKANPGGIKYYVASPGSLQAISTRDFLGKAGITGVGVPMQGDQPAVQNLLTGIIQIAPLTAGPVLSNPDTLTPIAVMADQRLEKLPDVPTLKEKGFDVAYDLWGAIVAPQGLPAAVKAKLEAACQGAQESDDFKQAMNKFNMPVVYQSGSQFEAAFRKEFVTAGEVLSEIGLKKN
ncbi:MAG: tripartite tricarboxylate transporter substrate binding protein [Rhodospirillaceae bacterium]